MEFSGANMEKEPYEKSLSTSNLEMDKMQDTLLAMKTFQLQKVYTPQMKYMNMNRPFFMKN